MDRRAVFFLVAAALSAALIPLVPDDPKHPHVSAVGPALVAVSLLLAVLSVLDHLGRTRRR